MPNWCEGIMRVRGSKENLIKFLKNGIVASSDESSKENPPKIDDSSAYWLVLKNTGMAWIKDTTRMFVVDNEIELYLDDPQDDGHNYLMFNIEQAWGLDPTDFLTLSHTYDLDFKCIAWERGMGFEQTVECNHDWKAATSDTKTYKNWLWDCPNPFNGG